MKSTGVVLGIASVALLNVILAVGNGRSSDAVFHAAIELLPWVMLPSSVVFAYLFWARGHRVIGALFAGNVMLFAVAIALMAAGTPLTASVLFVTDVLQLNLYLVALTRHWTLLTAPAAALPMLA